MTPKNDNKLLKAAAAFVKGIEPIEDDMIIDYLLGKLPADEAAALTDLQEQDEELADRVARMREIIAPVLDPEYMAQAKARLFCKLARQNRAKSLERILAIIRKYSGEDLAQARETIAGFALDLATLCQAPVQKLIPIGRSDQRSRHDASYDWARHLGIHFTSPHPDPMEYPLLEGGEIQFLEHRQDERWMIRARPDCCIEFIAFCFVLLDDEGKIHFSKHSTPNSIPAHAIEISRELVDCALNPLVTTLRLDFT